MSNDNDFELDFDDDETTVTETVTTTEAQAEDLADTDTDGTPAEVPDAQVVGTVESTDAQVAEAQAETAKADEAAAKAKAEADQAEAAVEAFKSAANATLTHEDRDQATGELPVVVVQTVLDAYAAVPGAKYKAQAKAYLTDKMQELMVEGAERPDAFFEARTIMSLSKSIKDSKTPASPTVAKPKVDPTEAHAERIAAMMLAPSLVAVPDEVEATWAEKAQALAVSLEADVRKYNEWVAIKDQPLAEGETAPEAPEVSPVVLAAVKIAAGRAAGTTRKASTGTSTPRASTAGSGHRGDIGTHIREAMNTVDVNDFMSIADIAKVETSQYGGDKPAPSQGAIAARLFPSGDASKCNLDFVRPEGKEQGHERKGAVRTA